MHETINIKFNHKSDKCQEGILERIWGKNSPNRTVIQQSYQVTRYCTVAVSIMRLASCCFVSGLPPPPPFFYYYYNLASCKSRARNLTDLSPTKRAQYHQSVTFYQPSLKFSIRYIIPTFILLFQAAHPLNSCNKHLIKCPCIKRYLRE